MVTVWLARVDDAPGAAAVCDRAERCRVERHHDPLAGHRWLVARGVLRTVLGAATGADARALTFGEGPHGKPSIAGAEFSLSHTGPFIAIAIGPAPVGIDIELPRRIRRPERLAGRLFGDVSSWSALDDAERTPASLRAWTRTEAVLKATGAGAAGGLTGAVDRLAAAGWVVRDLPAVEQLFGAVAAHGPGWDVDGPYWWDGGGRGGT